MTRILCLTLGMVCMPWVTLVGSASLNNFGVKMVDKQALYNANDGLTGRSGGPYLDQKEMEDAEVLRAKAEGRKPDLDNPPASAGVLLVTGSWLLANHGVNNLPSESTAGVNGEVAVKALADDKNTNLKVHSFRAVREDGTDVKTGKSDTPKPTPPKTRKTVAKKTAAKPVAKTTESQVTASRV